jgi:anti-sigma-K factor RskA
MDGPIAYQMVTTKYPQPHSDLSDWCRRLASDYGAKAFEDALRAEHKRDHNTRTLLSRTESQLAMAADLQRSAPKLPRAAETLEQRALYEETRRRLANGEAI